MNYKVVRTNSFYSEAFNVFKYIRYSLMNEKAAADFRASLYKAIEDLKIIGAACKRLDVNLNITYRAYPCCNYLIIFTLEGDTLYLQHLFYAKSDINNRLKDFSDE